MALGHATTGCGDWAKLWPALLDRMQPDVVVVLTTIWDIGARQRDEWGPDYLNEGDPRFDQFIESEWRARGERARRRAAPGSSGSRARARTRTGSPPALNYANSKYIPDARPHLDRGRQVDLASGVCPDGKFSDQLGPGRGRPARRHPLLRRGADWVASWLGPQLADPTCTTIVATGRPGPPDLTEWRRWLTLQSGSWLSRCASWPSARPRRPCGSPAADVGAGVGPGRRQGPGRGLRARRRRPDPRGRSRPRARSPPPGLEPDSVDGLWWGTTRPPFAEGPSHAVLAVGDRPLAPVRRRARRGLAARRAWTRCSAAADAVGAGLGAGRARRRLRRARPGPRHRVRSAVRRRRRGRSCSRPTAAPRRSPRGSPAPSPLLDRYRGDGESATRDLYDPRLFREEMFLPDRCARSASTSPRSTSARGRSPIPTAGSAPPSRSQLGATARRVGRGLRRGRRHRRRGPAARRDRRARRRGRGRDRRLRRRPHDRRRSSPPTQPVPGAAARRGRARRRAARDLRRGAARPGPARRRPARLIPMGVPPESALFVRGADEMLAAARRPLRRLRDDQHAAVDPPALHRVRRHEVRAGAARPPRRRAHLRREPDDAGAVRRAAADRGHRPRGRRPDHAAGRRRRHRPRDRHRGRARAAPLRARARRPGLRLEGRGTRRADGGCDHELEQGRGRRRRADQVRRAVRAELRADGRRARSAPRATPSTRASTRSRSTPRSSRPSAARSGARRASAATPSRPRSASPGSRAPASRTRARRAPTRSGSARWPSPAACTTSCS